MNPQQLRDRSQRFSLDIIHFCEALSREPRVQTIAGQLQEAATSAAMNYRAACRARSHAEFVSKICITTEESDEALGWLEVLADSGRASGAELKRLTCEATELLKIFAASKRTAMSNAKRRAPKTTQR